MQYKHFQNIFLKKIIAYRQKIIKLKFMSKIVCTIINIIVVIFNYFLPMYIFYITLKQYI